MLISEMIARLEQLKAEHGDLPVYTDPKCYESYWLDPVASLTVSPVRLAKEARSKVQTSRNIDFYCAKDDPRGAPNAIEINFSYYG